mmetsp:Transcript_18235/g.61958  ORF Transcript_18235/g.61958 Transcript_18235/m.61958 type:complete len:91 (-) Transcript_18235:566-838(-)
MHSFIIWSNNPLCRRGGHVSSGIKYILQVFVVWECMQVHLMAVDGLTVEGVSCPDMTMNIVASTSGAFRMSEQNKPPMEITGKLYPNSHR